MYFRTTAKFAADFKRLSDSEKEMVRRAARAFSEACDHRVNDESIAWPGSLRVKAVQGAPGVFEMTWSFSGPDGRATWEWVTIEVSVKGKKRKVRAVQWRRVGRHDVFTEP